MTAAVTEWPDALIGLSVPTGRTSLRLCSGRRLEIAPARWHDRPAPEDHDALARVVGPVVDIGCGPGRHVRALIDAGHDALGIDVSPSAVRAARHRGARAVRASVWGPVPGTGYWQTGLLLDGNIGIGGDPVALLRRAVELLGGGRRLIVELSPGALSGALVVRVEHGRETGPWFPWAVVTPESIHHVAADAGLRIEESWRGADRWFACLTPNHRDQRSDTAIDDVPA